MFRTLQYLFFMISFFHILQSSFMRILFCAAFILIYEDVTIIIFLTFWKATVNDIKYGCNFYEIGIMQRKNICIVATEGHGPTRTCREKNNSTPIRCEKIILL